MTTYLQTVLVYRPNSDLVFTTEALHPVPPPALQKTLDTSNRPVGLLRIDGSRVIWWRGGHVTVTEKDGTERVFWPKPTRGNAVEYALTYPSSGASFQFFADGSVAARCFGGIYYYGPEMAGLSEDGSVFYPYEEEYQEKADTEHMYGCCNYSSDEDRYDRYDSD